MFLLVCIFLSFYVCNILTYSILKLNFIAMKSMSSRSELGNQRKNEALIQVRKALGLKQVEFAELVQFSPSQIASVELGRRAATSDFAWQVAVRTGVDPQCLLRPGVEVHDQKGRPYSRKSYEDHLKPETNRLESSEFDELLVPLKITLEAAADAGRLRTVACKIRESVQNLIVILPGLQEAVERLIESSSGSKFAVTVGQLRQDSFLAMRLCGEQADKELQGCDDNEVVWRRQSEPLAALWRSAWYRPAESLSSDDH